MRIRYEQAEVLKNQASEWGNQDGDNPHRRHYQKKAERAARAAKRSEDSGCVEKDVDGKECCVS
jgi:hypothetical protein